MENYSGMMADISAVTRPNFMNYGACNGFGLGGWEGIIGLIVLAGIFGGGFGNGFGGNGAGWQQGFNTQNILSKLDGITNGLSDGFYAVNTNNLQMQNQLQRDLCQGFSATNAAIAENRFAAQHCCCETQRAIDGVNYNNAKNTCEIVNAIHAEGEATRGLITQNAIQELRDKLADKDRELQVKDLTISQMNQNAYLIQKLNSNCCTTACGCGYQQ